MTIQQHASFDSSAAELNATSKLVKAWESKNAKNAAKAGGISLMALSLAACGGSSTPVADAPAVADPVVPVVPVVDAAKSIAFTANLDNLKGGSGDDSFNGVYYADGGTGTTAFPGDVVDGGVGSDTLNISVAGKSTAAVSINAIRTSNVETVLVTNYDTNITGGQDTTIDTSLMSGIVNVGLNASSAVGDTIFTGMTSIVGASMANGSGDLTLTYTATPIAGTADTQTVTVSNVTAGTFTANGAETIAIDTSLAKSTLTNVASDTLKTLDIGGDQALTISTALTNTTIDASDNTGGVTLTLGANAAHVVKGGSGADTIDAVGTLTSTDTLTGGAGSDVLKLTVGAATIDKGDATTKGELYNVTGFETVDIASTDDTATLNLKDTDITAVDLAANTKTVTFTGASTAESAAATITFVLNGVTYTSTADLSGDAAADVAAANAAVKATIDALSGFTATAGATGAITVTADTGEVLEISVTDQTGALAAESAYSDVTVSNIGTQALNVYSADAVTASLADASGTADSLTINLATRAADDGVARSIGNITANNIETINLDATGMDNGIATTVAAVKGNAMATLNITGDSDVTISNFDTSAKLATIDAGTSTGDVSLAAAPSAVDQTITTGGGNDTIAMGAFLTDKDVIDAGGNNIPLNGTKNGSDTVTATGNIGTVTSASALQIANAESIQLSIGAAASTYIDASKITGTSEIAFSNDTNGGTVKLTNLGANHTVGVGIGAVELGETATTTLDLSLADETGAADAISLNYTDTASAASLQTLKVASTVETLNISAGKVATAATITNTNMAAKNIVITDGIAGGTVTLGTLNAATTNVDAGAAHSNISVTTAATGAVTVSAAGDATSASSITTGAGNDTITLTGKIGTLIHTVDGGAGTGDVANITLSSGSSDFTNVANVETLNLTIGADTDAGFVDGTDDAGLNLATTVNILGGDSLSSFTIGTTAVLDDDAAGTTMTLDASTFGGAIDIATASDAFDAELTIKGGALTTDKVTTTIAGIDNKVAAMTGVETLVINSTDTDTAAKADLTNVSGLVTIDAKFTNNNAADQISIAGITAGTKIKTTSTATGDNLVLALTDATGTSDSITLEVTATTADNDTINIDAAGIETLAITNKDATTLDLAGLTATGTGTSSVTIAGAGASILNGINATTDSIDATTATGALTVAAAQRTGDAKTIKGGEGADSLAMENAGDTMAGGLGTNDTLVVAHTGILGGIAVDLSAADQISTFDTVSNATVQDGFENIDVSAYTNFGASIVGSDGANVITGTASTDQISGGKGDDTINVTDTTESANDIMDGGAGTADTIHILATTDFTDTDANIVNVENITMAAGSVNVVLTGQSEGFTITGGTGANSITGGSGADTINGGAEADVITGADGADLINGGAGNDTFVIAAGTNSFTSTSAIDTTASGGVTTLTGIDEYRGLNAGDKIDLSAVDGSSAISDATVADGTTELTAATSGGVAFLLGTFDADAKTFTEASAFSATANDYLVEWADGTNYEAVVFVDVSAEMDSLIFASAVGTLTT